MSYCRPSNGDVYLYADVDGGWTCCACGLPPLLNWYDPTQGGLQFPPSVRLSTIGEVVAHLEKHRTAGHQFPDSALERARNEAAEHGAAWAYESTYTSRGDPHV